MDINKMRKIDYWFGIPLCFLLSGLNCIKKAVNFKEKNSKPIKKVLFIKLSELGAIVLSFPFLNRIKEEYPAAELFFVTFQKNTDIFKLSGGIIPDRNVLGIREGSLFFILDTLRAIQRLRKEEIDIVFDLEFFSRFSAVFACLVNARKRAGFYRYHFEGLYRGNLLTHRIEYNPLLHITRNYLSFIEDIEEAEKNTPELKCKDEEEEITFPKYVSNNEAREKVLRKMKEVGVIPGQKKVFLVNPGDGVLPLREWPLENFIALSRLILENENHYIILIGTDGAQGRTKVILETIQSPGCVSLVGQTELDELLELFTVSDILIANDCGLAHLGMLTSIKKIVIFGPESPKVFGPMDGNSFILYSDWPCSPCLSAFNHRVSSCRDNLCLKAIVPGDVYELIKKI